MQDTAAAGSLPLLTAAAACWLDAGQPGRPEQADRLSDLSLLTHNPSLQGSHLLTFHLQNLLQLPAWAACADQVGSMLRTCAAQSTSAAPAARANLILSLLQACLSRQPGWVDSSAGLIFLQHAVGSNYLKGNAVV